MAGRHRACRSLCASAMAPDPCRASLSAAHAGLAAKGCARLAWLVVRADVCNSGFRLSVQPVGGRPGGVSGLVPVASFHGAQPGTQTLVKICPLLAEHDSAGAGLLARPGGVEAPFHRPRWYFQTYAALIHSFKEIL